MTQEHEAAAVDPCVTLMVREDNIKKFKVKQRQIQH